MTNETTPTISRREVRDGIAQFADVLLDAEGVKYMRPVIGPLATAITVSDAEAVAYYATRGVQTALGAAGFETHMTHDALRQLVGAGKLQLIHDVVNGRENAAGVLKSLIDRLSTDGQFAAQATAHAPRRATQDITGADPRDAGQVSGPGAGQVPDPSVPRRREHHPLDGADHGRGVRRQTGESPVPQRHDASNVRDIGDHRAQNRNAGGASAPAKYDQKKVHGGKAALNFEADATQRLGDPTIRLETARRTSPQERTYDWKNKIAVQLTVYELQLCTALLLGMIDKVKFQNHGPEQDKWFEFEHQSDRFAGSVKVVVGKGKDLNIVSITHLDIGDVTAMFIRQCAAQLRLDHAAVPATLRRVAESYTRARDAASGSGRKTA